MLGIAPAKGHGYAKSRAEPALNLSLNEVRTWPSRRTFPPRHQVASTDDVFAIRQRWADALITRDEMQTDCCYAKQGQDRVTIRRQRVGGLVLEDNLPETKTRRLVLRSSRQRVRACAPRRVPESQSLKVSESQRT